MIYPRGNPTGETLRLTWRAAGLLIEGGTDEYGLGVTAGGFDAELGEAGIEHRGHFRFDGVEADVAGGEFGAGDFEGLTIEPDANGGDDARGILIGGGEAGGPGGFNATEAGEEDLDAHAGAQWGGGLEEFAGGGIEQEGCAVPVGEDGGGRGGEVEIEAEVVAGAGEIEGGGAEGGVIGNLELGFVVGGGEDGNGAAGELGLVELEADDAEDSTGSGGTGLEVGGGD